MIGNPPYGVSIKGDYRMKVLKILGKVPDFEIYYYFIEVAKIFLKGNGIKSYIIPNTFLFNVFASEYRKKLLIEWNVKIMDCTAFKIFEGATVYNAITFFSKANSCKYLEYKITQNAVNFQQLIKNKTVKITVDKILKNNQNWCLVFKLDKNVLELILKIRENSNKLSDYFPEFSQGLIAYDRYQGQSEETIKNRIFHYKSKEKDDLKKWLWGSDVTKYTVNWNGEEWLDYCDKIANPRNPKFFKGERLLIREITNPSIFCGLATEELYHDPANIVILKGNKYDLKTLLAIMNSKIATFYHFNSSPKATKGAFPKILVEDIKNFPIPIVSKEIEQQIIHIINEIIKDKKLTSSSDTSELENEIDKLVYDLYKLDDDEISIIEK
nr:TaqI-like C-terminal specificity domain-containing protein [Chryseobacterium sp. 8AT]